MAQRARPRRVAPGRRVRYIVTVPAPLYYTKTDVADYIRDAVRAWGGQLRPEDELFDLCRPATVKIIKEDNNG